MVLVLGINMNVGIGNINNLKKQVLEQFRIELPVMCVKARILRETIADRTVGSYQIYDAIETSKKRYHGRLFLRYWRFSEQ